MDNDPIVLSSDSEEDESKNKQFQLLWKNAQPILNHHVLVEYKTTEFPYGRFKELAEVLRKSLSVVFVQSRKAFIWKNIIRWLASMRQCYNGITDLKGDKKYNLILTDFMTQYMNYKCDLYSSITDKSEVREKVDEILFTLEDLFNGDIPGILMTLLRIEIKNEYRLILEPIFRKYLTKRSLHEPNELISYLRLLFCYKQWMKLFSLPEDKEIINEIAVGKSEETLRSGNSSKPVDLTEVPVLPKMVPAVNEWNESFTAIDSIIGFAINDETKKKHGTRFLLINKSFELKEVINKYFQQYEKYISQKDTNTDKETQKTVSNDKQTNETVPPVVLQPPYIQSHISQGDSKLVEGFSSNVVPRPKLLEGSSYSFRKRSFPERRRRWLQRKREQQTRQNNNTIGKKGTKAGNQHLTTNCDISNSNSKLSSNRKQNSRNFKKKTKNTTSDVFLSYSNNKKVDCIELDTTDDETTHTDDETMPPVVALPPYIKRLKRLAEAFSGNVSKVKRDCPIVLICSSDEDEVATVDPAKQSSISNTNAEGSYSVPMSVSPEVDQITDRLPHRIEEHGEKAGRKEELRCITGEVSSTTSLDFSSIADAESFVVSNGATLYNSREVGMERTSPESESVFPDSYYYDISATRTVKRLCLNKFSKVVEEATSSTSETEIPLRFGSKSSSDNVIFSIHAHRPRRSNSSIACPTRTTSPTDNCTNIASSTTIRTSSTKPAAGTHQRVTSASRIKVRRLNSLIGVQSQSDLATRSLYVDRPPAMVSFDSDSTKRSESTRQNTETVTDLEACDPVMQGKDIVQEEVEKVDQSLNSAAGVSLESEDYSEAPTCSRYVGPIVQAVSGASQGRTSNSATDGTPVTTTTKMPITPDIASKSEVNLKNSKIAGPPSVSADGQLMAIASNRNNSSISKLVEDISVHIGDSVEESHLERSDGKSGSIGSQEKIPKSFEPATVKPNGSGHNNFEISLASELKSNDVKAVVEVQKLPREIAIVASATLSIEPQSDLIQEYEKQDILRNQEPGSVVKSSEASTLKIPKSLFKEHTQKNTAEECKSIARREKQDKVLKTKTSKVKESKTIPKPETADKSYAFQRNIISGIVADDLTSPLTNKLPNSAAVEYLNKSKTSNGQLLTDTSKSSEFRKTGRGMTVEDNSMDAVSTSLMEDEFSNDEEIESPAYEAISPIPPEKTKKTPKNGEQNILALIHTETKETVFNESISKKQFFDDKFNSSAIVKNSKGDSSKDQNDKHNIEDDSVSDKTTEDLTNNSELSEVQKSENDISKDGSENHSIEDPAIETLTSDSSSKDQDQIDDIVSDLTKNSELPEVKMCEDDIPKHGKENHSFEDSVTKTLSSEGSSKDQPDVSDDTTEDLTNNNELLEVQIFEDNISKDGSENHRIEDPAIATLTSDIVSYNTTKDLTDNIELPEVQMSEDHILKDGNENHSFEDSVTKTLTSEGSSKSQIDVSDNTTDDLTTKSELSETQNSEDYISKYGNENHRIEDPAIETLTSDIVSDNTTEDLTDNIELPEVQMSEDNIPKYGNEKYSIEDTATETLTSDGSSKDQINDIVNDNTTEDLTDHIGLPEVPMSEDDIPRDKNENPSSENSVTKTLTSEGSSKDQIDVSDDTTEDLTSNIELPEVQMSEDDILKDRSENQSFENQLNKMSGNEKETVNCTKEALSHQTIEDEQQIESEITADITSKDVNSLQWTGHTQSSVDRIPSNETMKDYAYKQKDHCNEHTPEKPTCFGEKFILQCQCPLVKDQTVAENVLNNGELRAQEQLPIAVTTASTIDVHNQLMDAPEVTSEEIPEINKETEKSTDSQKIKVKLSEKETKPFTKRGIEREHKINKLTEVTNTRVKYSDETLSVQVEFITPDESQIEESTEDVTPDVSTQLIATDCLVTKKNLANRKFSKEIISAMIEVSHDESTLEECTAQEKFIQKTPPKEIITPDSKGLEMHKEKLSDSSKITSLSENSAKITGELQSGLEKASAPTQRASLEELIYDKQIVSAKSHETAKEMKSEFDNIRTIKEITDTNIVYTKATSKTEAEHEVSTYRPATFKGSNEKSSGNILKSNEKPSVFSSCASEADLLAVLNLRRTEVPKEDDSNLFTHVQVTTKDLGDPALSFNSETSDNLPGYPENGYHTPKRNFEEPCFHAEDQEVSEITSQEGDLPYNTYHVDCGTPVLDEKNGEEIESPKSPREITSLSVLKEICKSPKNETPFYQNSSKCLPISAGTLGLDSPFSSLASIHLHSQMKTNQDSWKSYCSTFATENDNIPTTPKTSKLGFIEPSPKQKSTIETDFKFQGTPKMRFKRQMSQCADINEEFNMGSREQPVKHIEITKVHLVEKYGELVKDNSEGIHVKEPLPNYSVPLNLEMRPDKHSKSSNIVKFPQTTTESVKESVKDTFILEEEDQNLRFPESQFKKLGIPKTNHKPLSKELHSPTLLSSSKSLFTKFTDVPEVPVITKQHKTIENAPQYTPLCTKSGGRRKKPRRVRKWKERSESVDDGLSSECHLTLPIVIQNTALTGNTIHAQTIKQTPIAEISYNSEVIKVATILSNMKSNKVDESLKIDTEKQTKSRRTPKKKKTKQRTTQYVRLTRSNSQLMDKLPFSDTPVSPPANSSKSVGKKVSTETKCFANQKSPIYSSCDSNWQQHNTQEILRSYAATSATSATLPQRVESDERKQIETENPLPLMNGNKPTTCLDSYDAAKLVIDFSNQKSSQKSTRKNKKNKQRKGTGGKKKKKISEKITESLQKGKAVMKKENSSLEVKYDENLLRSPNPVFKLASEVDVYFPSSHRPDDEVARLCPTISLSEDALSTSKTMEKHGQKQTPKKRKVRASEMLFSDINRIKEPTDVLTLSVIGTKFAAKSIPTSKSRKVAKPENTLCVDVKLKPIPGQKAGFLDEPPTEVKSASQLKTADAILGHRIDSPQSVQEKTNSGKDQENSELLTCTSPQITMTKETWLKNLSLKKTLNEVVQKLSEAKEILKSPTDSTFQSKIKNACSLSPLSTSMVGRLMSTEKILLHDLKYSQPPIEKAARIANRRKSLVTSKVMPLFDSITPDSVHSNSEVGVLKIKEELKQLQSVRNCRKRLRRTVRIVNAEPTENSEDNEQTEDSTSPKLPIQSSEARPTEISTEIVHLDVDASTSSEINRSELPITKSTQRLPGDCSLKNTDAIHIPKTTENTKKKLQEKESIATKKSAVHKQKKSVQEDGKCSDALHSLLAVKSRGESQQQLKEISELKAAATPASAKQNGSLLYAESANNLKTPGVETKNQIPEKIELQSTANLSEPPEQIKLVEAVSNSTDNAEIVKSLGETQQQIKEVVTETKTKTEIHKAKKSVETVTPPGDSTTSLTENIEFKAKTNSVTPKQKEPTKDIPKCTDTSGQPLQQCKKVKVTTNQAEPTKKKTVDNALKLHDIENSLDGVQTALSTVKLLTKGKRSDSQPSAETIEMSKETQCKLNEALESPEQSKKESQITNLSSECQVAGPLAKRRKSEGKALRSTNAKQIQQQIEETSRVRVTRSKSIGEASKGMESTVGYTLKKTTQQPKEIDIPKSDLHVPKYQEKSVDVKNDVNEIKTNSKGNIEERISLKIKIDKDTAQIVNKDVKPKLVMQIRRVSIDETNLKITLEKSSEVSKKHTKRPKRLHKRLAVEKSTETNDMSGWAEPRKEEQVEVVGHNNLDKLIQTKGTAATVEVGVETVAVIENTKAVGIPQQHSIKTSVENSKNETVAKKPQLVCLLDEVPVSELVKEAQCKGNELSPVLITTSEAPKSNLVDPNSHKSTESIAVLSLEKQAAKGDLDITQSVVTTTMPDNEENINELNPSQIDREAQSLNQNLKSDSQANNFELNLNDAPSKDESLKAIQPTHVTCAMDNDQDSKRKEVIQKSVQAYEKGANRLNRSCPKSRQKSIISIRRKRPVILLKKLRYKLISSDLAEVDILVAEGSKTPTKVLDIPTEKKMSFIKTGSAQFNWKRVSLDCHRSSTNSSISLRTRSVSENVVYNETSLKQIKLSSPIVEETIIAIDENAKASKETEYPESVPIKVEVNQKDEIQRFDEQLELSIDNILGNQLLKANKNDSSVTMQETLLTNQPQGFDSVPVDFLAGNVDTNDTVDTKCYPPICKSEDLMLETTPTHDAHQMKESEIEAQNLKLDPDDNDGDLKEPPLKKSNFERDNEESENSVNLVNGYHAIGSSTELEWELDFAMTPDIDGFPCCIVQSEYSSEVSNEMMKELIPLEQSDRLISGYGLFTEDMVCLPPINLGQDIGPMTAVNPNDVFHKIPKRNYLVETLTASYNEFSPDIEFEIFSNQPQPNDKNDNSVIKKPNSVQSAIEEPRSDVSEHSCINYFVPAVDVSIEVGFETPEELIANSSIRYFPSPDLANSSNPNPSTITGKINQVNETTTSLPIVGNELALAFNLDSENARESKQNEKTKVESGQDDKSIPVSIMADNGINKQPNAFDQMKNHGQKVEKSYSPSNTTTDKSKWSRAKLLAPIPSKLKDLSLPLKITSKKSGSHTIISNIAVQTKLNVTPLDSSIKTIKDNLSSNKEYNPTIKNLSFPANLESIEEVQPRVALTKLPDLGEIVDSGYDVESDVSPDPEPPKKKKRIESIARLSTNDLFDRLKRESPVNTIMRTSKPVLKQASSYETDDNSSRDSALGSPTVSKPPDVLDTEVVLPTRFLPSMSPVLYRSMPLISTPPREETTPDITNKNN